jgi:hypothetical protein
MLISPQFRQTTIEGSRCAAGIDTWRAGSRAPSRAGAPRRTPGTFWLVTIMRRASAFVVSSHSRASGRRSKLSSALPHWPSRRYVSRPHPVTAEAILTCLDLGSSAVCRRGRSAPAQSPNDRTLAYGARVRYRTTKPVVGPGSRSRSEDVVRDQEQDVAAKQHLVEPIRIRPERASKVGRGGSRAPTLSAVVARNILDGILYVDKL